MSDCITLTKERIEALKPPATGRLYVRDDKARGLLLQVTPTGARSLQLYRFVKGRPVRIVLGHYDPAIPESRVLPIASSPDAAAAYVATRPRLNLRQARELVRLLPSAAVKPADLKRQHAATKTVSQLLDDHEQHLAKSCRPGAVERVKWARQRVEKHFGNTKVTELDYDTVERWHRELVLDDGPHSANRAYELLRAAVGHHVGKGRPNPVAGITKAPEPKRARFLLAHEAPAFLAELEQLDQHWRDLFMVLLLTGARRGAVQAMRWQHVELAAGVWHLPAADAKNSTPTTVVLPAQAIEILQRRSAERVAGSPFVFPSDSESGHVESPKKAWAVLIDRLHRRALIEALAAAKVKHPVDVKLATLITLAAKHKIECPRPDLRPHDLRRSLGSWMANGNTSLQIVGKALGHKSAGSTAIYARLQVDPVRVAQQDAVDRMLATAGRVVDLKKAAA